MIFLISGVDNSGKDTIIRELQAQLDIPAHVLHYSGLKGPKHEVLEKSKVLYKQSIEIAKYIHYKLKGNVIFNRFWEGEYCYGQIYRSYTQEEANYIYELETLDTNIVKGVYVTANVRTLLNRDDGLSQSQNKKEKIIEELYLFEKALDLSRYNFSTINTSGATPEYIQEFIKGILN